jgi:hypothetical protein
MNRKRKTVTIREEYSLRFIKAQYSDGQCCIEPSLRRGGKREFVCCAHEQARQARNEFHFLLKPQACRLTAHRSTTVHRQPICCLRGMMQYDEIIGTTS